MVEKSRHRDPIYLVFALCLVSQMQHLDKAVIWPTLNPKNTMNHTLKLILALAVSLGLFSITSEAQSLTGIYPSDEDVGIGVLAVAVVVGGTILLINSQYNKKKAGLAEDSSVIRPMRDRSLSYAKYGDAKALRAQRGMTKRFKTLLRTNKSKGLLLAFNKQF
jgi:hypothetical protein